MRVIWLLKQYSSPFAIKSRVIQQLWLGKSSIINELVNNESEISYHTIFQAHIGRCPVSGSTGEAAYYYGVLPSLMR